TIRILFNQHVVAGKNGPTLVAGSGDALFGLADSWQLLAVVEHQVGTVTVDATKGNGTLQSDHRWTAMQEVRLATPAAFRGFLQKLKTFHGLDENGQPVALPESLAGYDNPTALSLLLGKSGTPGEIEKLGNALLVEASVAFWVRPHA